MRVLIISIDKEILKPHSKTQKRLIEYGALVEELHIIVLLKTWRNYFQKEPSGKRDRIQILNNVFIYPVVWWKAYNIGKKIIKYNEQWVITTQDPFETALLGYWLRNRLKVPLNIQLHGDFYSTDYWRKERLINQLRFYLGKYLLKRADSTRVVSKRIEQSLINLGIESSKIVIVPIYTSVNALMQGKIRFDLHKKYPRFDFIILTMARSTKAKNIPLLLNAFKKIVKYYPRTGLVIVGRDSLYNNLPLGKNIIFEDWADDVISYYKTADLYVLTSNYEGWGRVIIEAMACGLPVVMTDVGCAREVVGDNKNGLIIPVNDQLALEKAILRMLREEDLRKALKKGALETVSQLLTKEETFNLYKQSWNEAINNYTKS